MTARLVYVEWFDSAGFSDTGWQRIKGLELTPIACQSVGWVSKETDTYMTIIPHRGADNQGEEPVQGFGILTIPKSAIVRILPCSIDGMR